MDAANLTGCVAYVGFFVGLLVGVLTGRALQ